MAADTPTIRHPVTSGVEIHLDEILACLKSPYSGAGTQVSCRWQVSLTNSFPASGSNLVFDTLLRENDDWTQGDDWAEIPLAMFTGGPDGSTTYYVSCMVRNSAAESSSWATAVSFTTEAAAPTAAVWQAGQ